MAHAAYDGVFLAPESIVTLPGVTPADLSACAQADLAGVRAERFAETEQHPGRNAFEQQCFI